jgi:hypothetical protein
MNLRYEFVTVTGKGDIQTINDRLLNLDFDFVYSPFTVGQHLFRLLPELDNQSMPVPLLLFKYAPCSKDITESCAAQDISSGIEYLAQMGWEGGRYEWKKCNEDMAVKKLPAGEIPIKYKYELEGDDFRIMYEVDDSVREKWLIEAMENILEACRTPTSSSDPFAGYSQEEFADRIKSMASRALDDYFTNREGGGHANSQHC